MSKPHVGIIIQARMEDPDFPGKVLAPLAGKPMLEHVIDAARRALNFPVYVAIPKTAANQPLELWLQNRGEFYTAYGDGEDVLTRLDETAERFEVDVIVRLTADCPLVDHRLIPKLVNLLENNDLGYAGQTNDPDGSDVEVFTSGMLDAAAFGAPAGHDRLHVTPWMRREANALMLFSGTDASDVKFSVDTVDNLHTCERLIREVGIGHPYQDYVANLAAERAAAQRRTGLPLWGGVTYGTTGTGTGIMSINTSIKPIES